MAGAGERAEAGDRRIGSSRGGPFVGRSAELGRILELLVEDPSHNVLILHGPAGAGKTALLGEAARLAGARGFTVHRVDAARVETAPDRLEADFREAAAAARPLVLIDAAERMEDLGAHLRRDVLPLLPERAVVIVAGRGAPEPGWLEGGWENLATEMELGPLSREESAAILEAAGREAADRELDAGGGWPFVLVGGTSDPQERERLLAGEAARVPREMLATAALARVVTERMLADVLGPGAPADGLSRLAGLSFVDPAGEGVAVHDAVRGLVVAELRTRDRAREGDLRRRIADHLHARAQAGGVALAPDLAFLSEHPEDRWDVARPGPGALWADELREGDAGAIAARMGTLGGPVAWAAIERFFAEAPDRVAIAREPGGAPSGFQIALTPAGAPGFAAGDPVLGPWLADCRRRAPQGEALIWRCSVDLAGGGEEAVWALLLPWQVLRSGVANPHIAYLPASCPGGAPTAAARALGAVHEPGLDAGGETGVRCHVADWGPGGLITFLRDRVHIETGSEPPSVSPQGIREVLRNFAAQPPRHRAEVRRAAAEAFGHTPTEEMLREILLRGYLEPEGSHEALADALHLSRAAYFRRLKEASDRVAAFLGRTGWPPS